LVAASPVKIYKNKRLFMFYEIDNNGKLKRPLPGYFLGFHEELQGVNIELLSDMQKDYLSISLDKIIEVDEETHRLFIFKEQKLKEVSTKFNETLANGHFFSQSLQIDVDCRRSDTKNDLQNVQNLIKKMQIEGIQQIYYVGHTETVPVTFQQLLQLEIEMIDFGLQLYNKKWELESQISNAQSIAELENIEIIF
jgi:hypothetical protein